MKKAQTNRGAAAVPIIVGVVVIIVLIGIFSLGNKDRDEEPREIISDPVPQNAEEPAVVPAEAVVEPEVVEETSLAPVVDPPAPAVEAPLSSGSYEDYAPEKIAEAGGAVIFFHASWCPTCRNQEREILNNAAAIPSDLTILKADYDREVALKEKYGVRFQHSFVQVDAAGNVVNKWIGGRTLEDVIKNVK